MKYIELNQEEQKEYDQYIIEIMILGHLIQTRTDYCVFIRYSGHCDHLEVEVRESKKNWQKKMFEAEFYTKYKEYCEASVAFPNIRARIYVLKQILDTNDIPFNMLDYTTETIKHYFL
jgi:hypothetical protein